MAKTDDFLRTARERFKLANEADANQAQREKDDLAFYAGEQWPVDVKIARKGQQATAGLPATPERPTLVLNKVKEPVRQILNQERAADIGIELVPADDFGDLGVTPDDTEVTLREGLIRRIQRESIAADARTWAFARAVQAGRGYYLVMTRFLPGKTWDQEIYVHRIYNQAGVLLDPSHEQPDGSDADWGFIGTWMSWDRYTAEFPKTLDTAKNPYSDYTEDQFIALAEAYPDWYRTDTGKKTNKAVRIVDYWYTTRTTKDLAVLEDGSSMWVDELPKDTKPVDTRTVVQKTIQYCKIGGGVQRLEETDWAGPDLPIVKVLGEELQPYDNERRAEGMVRNAMDAQRGYNYMVSKQVEVIGLTPIPPLQVDPEAIEGFQSWYAVMNTRTLPYLPSRTYDDQGRQLAPPHRPAVDPNILPIAQSIALFDAGIKSTTAVPDPTLGNVDSTLKSGRAIREVVANAQQSTSNFLDNLTRSMRYEGQIINNLLYPIYGQKPGRLVRILTGENEPQAMRIGEDPKAQQAQRQQAAKVSSLTKDAHFNVLVKVTKSMDSRRQQEASTLGDLIGAEPQLMTWFGDLFFKNSDIPGRQALADRAKAMLAPPVQAMLAKQEQGGVYDPAAQAQIAQLTQQVQQAGQAIQQLAEEAKGKRLDYQAKVDTEKIRQDADIQKVQFEADKEVRLTTMKNAAAIEIARINAAAKMGVSAQEGVEEAIALDQTHAHEAALQGMQQAHDAQQQQDAQAHQVATGAAQAGAQADQSAQEHQQTLEQGDQATQGQIAVQAAAPQPTTGTGNA